MYTYEDGLLVDERFCKSVTEFVNHGFMKQHAPTNLKDSAL